MIQSSESSSIGSSKGNKIGKDTNVTLEPVESCSVTFSLSPATGLVVVSEQKGKLIRDRRADHWFRVQIICSILLLILLLMSPFLYNFFRERSVKAEHIKWLKSFYLMHAPEVRVKLHINLNPLFYTNTDDTIRFSSVFFSFYFLKRFVFGWFT